MKTNRPYILPILVISAAVLLMVVNVEAIVIGIFSVGLVAIAFCDLARSHEPAPLAGRRPEPAKAFPMGAQSLPAVAR